MNKNKIMDAFEQLPSLIKQAEIALEAHESYRFEVSDEIITNINYSSSEEYFVRVTGEKEGYYYTQDGNEEPYNMFLKAYENSLVATNSSTSSYNKNLQEESLNTQSYTLEELKKKALELYSRLSKKIKDGKCSIELIVSKTRMTTINNLGLDVSCEFPVYLLIGYLEAKEEDFPIYVRGDSILSSLDDNLDDFADDLKERFAYQKKPLSCFKSGEYRVLLHRNFVYVLLCTAWQLFSGKKYLEKASCYAGCINQKIGSSCLNFVDDNNGFCFGFDCEGSKCESIEIVKDGVYQNPLLNKKTSEALSLKNNGCAGRKPLLFGNIATDIQITPRNFKMEKGSKSYQELKEELKDGIIITEHFDIFHSLDIASGEFAIPCYGVKVEDGKEVGSLRALVVTGNIIDVFQNAIAVSSRLMKRPMHYLNNYGIGACDLLVSKMKVSGE